MKANEAPKTSLGLPLILVLLSAVLAPIFGGYLQLEQAALSPDLGSILTAAFGGSDIPVLTHTMLALPILLAAAVILLSRHVQQVPKQFFSITWFFFFIFAGVSIIFSSFRFVSLYIWAEWLVFGCTLFTVVAAAGRRLGPLAVSSAIGVGCFVVALRSISEFGANRGTDSTHRVFGGWVNPNATAAIMLLGFFALLAICLSRNRVEALLAGLAATLILFALPLTGSKGAVSFGLPIGLLAMAPCLCRAKGHSMVVAWLGSGVAILVVAALFAKNVGWVGIGLAVLTFACLVGMFGGQESKAKVGRAVGVFAAAAALSFLLLLTTPSTTPKAVPGEKAPAIVPSTPLGRVGSGSQTQEQSAEFRLNLWKSAFDLVKDRPITGWGMGSYQFESGRPGLTTATVFAHNVYLQIWAEAGSIPLLLFVGGLGCWFWLVLKNYMSLPAHQQALLSGVVAALVALLAHAMVDSDLYYFGIGLCFFMLMGVGLSISTDSVAPELIPKQLRVIAAFGSLALALLMFVFSADNIAKGTFREAQGKPESAPGGLETFAAFDGEARYMLALTQHGDEQRKSLESAFEDYPVERVARALARVEASQGNPTHAIEVLKQALERDPDNFFTLNALIQIQMAAGQTDQAVATAKRFVSIEETPYFKVRSIPENVPTDTYLIRFSVIAPNEKDPRKQADILAEGVRGMSTYADTTMKTIATLAIQTKDEDFHAPEFDSLKTAKVKLQLADDAAKKAVEIYRSLGNTTAEAEMEADARLFETAAGGNK